MHEKGSALARLSSAPRSVNSQGSDTVMIDNSVAEHLPVIQSVAHRSRNKQPLMQTLR